MNRFNGFGEKELTHIKEAIYAHNEYLYMQGVLKHYQEGLYYEAEKSLEALKNIKAHKPNE